MEKIKTLTIDLSENEKGYYVELFNHNYTEILFKAYNFQTTDDAMLAVGLYLLQTSGMSLANKPK